MLCNEYANQNDIIDINYNTITKIFDLTSKDPKEKEILNEYETKEKDCSESLETNEDAFSTGKENIFLKEQTLDENFEKCSKTETNMLIGNKRSRQHDCPIRESKRRRICSDDIKSMKESECAETKMKNKVKRLISFIKESNVGFKDEDFHIINESDEKWTLHVNGRIEKNIILTELVLSEKEIKMVSVIKDFFGN